jgi:hypothetical protein
VAGAPAPRLSKTMETKLTTESAPAVDEPSLTAIMTFSARFQDAITAPHRTRRNAARRKVASRSIF